jgi:hypothetical protein
MGGKQLKSKLPAWVTDGIKEGIKKVVTWAITGIIIAGISVYMDVNDLKKDMQFAFKNDERQDSQISKLFDRQDQKDANYEELLRKSVDKLDWIARELERRRK